MTPLDFRNNSSVANSNNVAKADAAAVAAAAVVAVAAAAAVEEAAADFLADLDADDAAGPKSSDRFLPFSPITKRSKRRALKLRGKKPWKRAFFRAMPSAP